MTAPLCQEKTGAVEPERPSRRYFVDGIGEPPLKGHRELQNAIHDVPLSGLERSGSSSGMFVKLRRVRGTVCARAVPPVIAARAPAAHTPRAVLRVQFMALLL